MKRRGIIKLILLSIVSIWIIVSGFFYFQHQIQVDRYYVGEYIEFDDFGVLVKNIEKYKLEQNRQNYSLIYPDKIINLNLPQTLTSALLKINYFYSQPYYTNKESYKYDVNCEIISDQEFFDSEFNRAMISEKMGIGLYKSGSSSLVKPRGRSISYDSDINVLSYTVTGNWNENYSDGLLKIIDNDNGEEYINRIDKPFETKTYNYFNRRVSPKQQMSSNIIDRFLWEYYNGKTENAETYIKEDCIENFHWSILDQYKIFRSNNYQLSYLGRFMDEEQVFSMKVLDEDLKEDLKFYLIYRDFDWQILNVE